MPFVDGEDLSGVLQDLARSFARAALQASLFGDGSPGRIVRRWQGRRWSAGGLLGGLFGRASGGPVRAGGVYMVGENGPEPFHIAPANGRIVSNGALQRMSQSGASSAAVSTISIAIDARGAQQGVARKSRRHWNQRHTRDRSQGGRGNTGRTDTGGICDRISRRLCHVADAPSAKRGPWTPSAFT